ncbi:MAG TPA: hypothetical protein VK198_13265, partial [Terriglobales bacterium]|nr:hypothetical protein [Terriglobales bacterium]
KGGLPVAVVEKVAVWPGATVLLEGCDMILGAAWLEGGGEVDVVSPPQPDKIAAKLAHRHTAT